MAIKKLLSQVYATAVYGKNLAYDHKLVDKIKLKAKVISIGNLTFGGTGKTPIVQNILNHFKSKNIKIAVVSRNYKAEVRAAVQVDITRANAAQFYGDEPTMLATQNPDVAFFVGPKKWETAHLAEKTIHPDIIIVDDGFQHRALHRDLDIVLLDSTVHFSDYSFFPKGRAREDFAALSRADFILLTKVNLSTEEHLEKIKSYIFQKNKIIDVSYLLQAQELTEPTRAIALAGIAHPLSFKKSIQKETKYELVDFVSFSDHHEFTKSEIEEVIRRKEKNNAQVILVTEKDWVKIQNLAIEKAQFLVLGLRTEILNLQKEFYEALDKMAHQAH